MGGENPHQRQPAQDAEHPGKLEKIEAERAPRAAVVLEEGGDAADHEEGMADAHERAAEHEQREGGGEDEAEETGGEEDRRQHQAQGDVPPGEEAGGGRPRHPREPERACHHSELPVRESTRLRDLRQDGTEGAYEEGVASHQQAQKRRAAQGVNGGASPKG